MQTFWVTCIFYIFVMTGGSSENTNTILPEDLDGKDESLRFCPIYEVGPEDYELLSNGSVRLEVYNLTLDEPFYVLGNGTLSICSISSSENTNDLLDGKDESLHHCPTIQYFPGEYKLLPNKSVYVDNALVEEPFYIIIDGKLITCFNYFTTFLAEPDRDYWFIDYVNKVGLVLSMIGLFLHLVVFFVVPDLRNLPGWNLASLCACLFVSYLLILQFDRDEVQSSWTTCAKLGSAIHFFLLSSFLWMFIMSFDVFASLLRSTGSLRSSNSHFSRRKFGLYCLCAFGIALLFSILGALEAFEFMPVYMQPMYGLCWLNEKHPLLVFFSGPVIVLSCLNFLLFGASAYVIHANKRKSDQDAQQPALKRRYLMYFRLSVIMGITWNAGFAVVLIKKNWIVFVLLNVLQVFFILFAFTFCKKVKKFFWQKIAKSKTSSQQTLTTPTFQSYCHYANSIEKDLDGNKEKVDTIMTHL